MNAAEDRDEHATIDEAQAENARRARPACSGCAALWEIGRVHPCGTCAARVLVAPAEDELRRRAARAVPRAFRDATWSNPDIARRVHGGAPSIAKARAVLGRARRVIIVGPSGAGKSTIGAAHTNERVVAGVERARFVLCVDIGGPSQMALALSAEVLVLDDFGAELEGAPAGSGLAAQRIGPAMRLIGDRYDRRRGWVITTALEVDAVARFYGDRIARRMYEEADGAAVIRLGGEA
jgi:DNA replication protein DnaC